MSTRACPQARARDRFAQITQCRERAVRARHTRAVPDTSHRRTVPSCRSGFGGWGPPPSKDSSFPRWLGGGVRSCGEVGCARGVLYDVREVCSWGDVHQGEVAAGVVYTKYSTPRGAQPTSPSTAPPPSCNLTKYSTHPLGEVAAELSSGASGSRTTNFTVRSCGEVGCAFGVLYPAAT